MTDRELAGCAQVRRYYHSPDWFSAMELDSDGEYVLYSDYAALLAKYEAMVANKELTEYQKALDEAFAEEERKWRGPTES